MPESTISREHQLIRDAWAQLSREGISQKDVVDEVQSLQGRLPPDAIQSVSTSYASQVLVKPKGEEKQPTTAKLRSITLALSELLTRHQQEISSDRVRLVNDCLAELMTLLQLEPAVWQDGEAPLPPGAINALERELDVEIENRLAGSYPGFAVSIVGGPKVGKTTSLLNAQAKARRMGYRVLFADLAVEYPAALGSESQFWTRLARRFSLPGVIENQGEFHDAFDPWLGSDSSRCLICLDSANVMLEGQQPAWAEQALGLFVRHFPQLQSSATPGSHWKRYSVIAAQTFAEQSISTPSLNSLRLLSGSTLPLQPLSQPEVEDLLRRHLGNARHRAALIPSEQADLTDGKTSEPASTSFEQMLLSVAQATRAWFGGHPMLIQDFLAAWAANPSADGLAERLRSPSPLATRFVGHLASQVRSNDPIPRTLVRATAEEEGRLVAAEPVVLELLLLVDFRAVWTAPYLAAWLEPRLTEPELGR